MIAGKVLPVGVIGRAALRAAAKPCGFAITRPAAQSAAGRAFARSREIGYIKKYREAMHGTLIYLLGSAGRRLYRLP
jgi:hypothetical protein